MLLLLLLLLLRQGSHPRLPELRPAPPCLAVSLAIWPAHVPCWIHFGRHSGPHPRVRIRPSWQEVAAGVASWQVLMPVSQTVGLWGGAAAQQLADVYDA